MRHHVGSGRRTVIHPDWETHHAHVVEGTFDGIVALREPGGTTAWSDELEQNVTTPHDPYFGAEATEPNARIQALAGEARVIATADDEETTADYLIVVPRSVHQVREGHQVDASATGDAALDGRTLTVVQVVRGTHRFERDLFCSLTD